MKFSRLLVTALAALLLIGQVSAATIAHITDGSSSSNPATVTNSGWGTDTRGLVAVVVAWASGSGSIAVTGGGVTWSQVTNSAATYSSRRLIAIFESDGTPDGGALTITASGATFAELKYSVDEAAEWSGTDPLCATAVNTSTAGATSLSVLALTGFSAGDVAYAALAVESGSASGLTADSGSLLHTAYTGGSDVRAFVAADQGSDSSPGFTWTTSSGAGMTAVRVGTGSTGSHSEGGSQSPVPLIMQQH